MQSPWATPNDPRITGVQFWKGETEDHWREVAAELFYERDNDGCAAPVRHPYWQQEDES